MKPPAKPACASANEMPSDMQSSVVSVTRGLCPKTSRSALRIQRIRVTKRGRSARKRKLWYGSTPISSTPG